MNEFWLGFLIGGVICGLVGGPLGVLAIAMCFVARRADDESLHLERENRISAADIRPGL
jgi:hypothetical protein